MIVERNGNELNLLGIHKDDAEILTYALRNFINAPFRELSIDATPLQTAEWIEEKERYKADKKTALLMYRPIEIQRDNLK